MLRSFYLALGWMMAAIIVWLSLAPSAPQIDLEQGDKLGHIVAYGALSFWFCLLYERHITRISYAILWIAMGIGLEFVQRELGYRTYDLHDMVANTMGVLIGSGLAFGFPISLPGAGKGAK